MSELHPWLLLAAVVLGLCGLVFAVMRLAELQRTLRDELIRVQARLDEQAATGEQRTRALAVLMREHDRALRDDGAALRRAVDQGLAEADRTRQSSLSHLHHSLSERVASLRREIESTVVRGQSELHEKLRDTAHETQASNQAHRVEFEQRHAQAVQALHAALARGIETLRAQVAEALDTTTRDLSQRMSQLAQTTQQHLEHIGAGVDRRLTEGFERTTSTFADIVKRLALIDEAQKRITELSGNVVSLQQVLSDKGARGAFGEVQLASLVRDAMPEASFSLQHTLSNGKIADCILFLPAPTGAVAIDAKFPLEAYQRMTQADVGEPQRTAAARQFKRDVQKHLSDIAERYIIPGETSDGAVMFIPAEAVFAEIQARHPDLVSRAQSLRVWMVSPTTLMAVLNTARAVLKDEATRAQVHVIQEHLVSLAQDFGRFRRRMDNLSRHIKQAGQDVEEVHTTARKISRRFERIERVELEPADRPVDLPSP